MRTITAVLTILLLSLYLASAGAADTFTDTLANHLPSRQKWMARDVNDDRIVTHEQVTAAKDWLKGELGLPASSEITLNAYETTGSAIQNGVLSGTAYIGAPMLEHNKKSYQHGIKFQIFISPDVEKRVVLAQDKLTLASAAAATLPKEISAKSSGRVFTIAGFLDDERIVFVTVGKS